MTRRSLAALYGHPVCACGRRLRVRDERQSSGRDSLWRVVPYVVATGHCGRRRCLPHALARKGTLEPRRS